MDKDKQYIRDPFYFNIYTNEKVEYTKGDIIKIQVMTMGEWMHQKHGKLVIDDSVIDSMITNFDNNVYQQEIPLNENHEEMKKAIGRFKNLYKEDDGLYGDVEINTRGAEIMNESIYKYVSIEFYIDYVPSKVGEERSKFVITGAGVTNHPYIKGMKKIVANEEQSMLGEMDDQHLSDITKNTMEVDLKEFNEMKQKVVKLQSLEEELEKKNVMLNETQQKLQTIEEEATKREFSENIDALIDKEKGLLPKDKEKVIEFCQKIGKENAKEFFDIMENLENVKAFTEEMQGDEKEEAETKTELSEDKANEKAQQKMKEKNIPYHKALSEVYSEHQKKSL